MRKLKAGKYKSWMIKDVNQKMLVLLFSMPADTKRSAIHVPVLCWPDIKPVLD